MADQLSFASLDFAAKKKRTKRDVFLAEMAAIVPWSMLEALIEPHYPKGQRGRPPIGLERMLRVYFLQQWYGLADEALEDALYDRQALQRFARIDLAAEGVPDATTLLNFRHLLETHGLCKGLFTAINADLAARGLLLCEGTLVDATLIAAPSSTKNARRERDPEIRARSLIDLSNQQQAMKDTPGAAATMSLALPCKTLGRARGSASGVPNAVLK